MTTRRSQRAHAAESLGRAARISALQRRSALLPEPARAREPAPAAVPHLCKRLGLSWGFSFSPLVSPIALISHSNFDGQLGIAHTQKSFVRSHARFRGLL